MRPPRVETAFETSNRVAVKYYHAQDHPESDSEPIVFLNGIGHGVNQLGRFPDELGVDVLAIDSRMAVKRAMSRAAVASFFYPPAAIASMNDYARETVAAIDELQDEGVIPGRPNIVGLSWGGTLAIYMKHRSPTSLNRVVAISTPHEKVVSPFTAMQTQLALGRLAFNWSTGASASSAGAEDIYGMSSKEYSDVMERLELAKQPDHISDMYQAQAMGRYILEGMYRDSSHSSDILRIYGARDRLTPPPEGTLLIDSDEINVPSGIDAVAIKGAGHLVPHTHGRLTAALTRNHFK